MNGSGGVEGQVGAAPDRLEADLVDRLYGALPSILVNLAVMPIVVGVVFWGLVPGWTLVAWVGASLLILAFR